MNAIDLTFEQLVEAAHKLRPDQKATLVWTLGAEQPSGLTRAMVIAETQALRAAGAFDHVVSLRNSFPRSEFMRISDAQLLTVIHEEAIAWEADLQELTDRDD